MSGPRVRIAPSPTGYFHVGTARAALFNWLFARQQAGTFVLRIEDTDSARNVAAHTAGILRALTWLGLDWDEGPYYQSQRSGLYAGAVAKLVAAGAVYACDCGPDAVAARARARGGPPGYDGYCRDRGLDVIPGRLLRFRTPDSGVTAFADVVRGEVSTANAVIEDFGIRKSNGAPLFLLANVVDDADMAISHVIRGEDHVPNTPKYILLWEALGYGVLPTFAHLPLLLSPTRKKLSKRRDRVAVEDYRDEGYLPEAVRNYLSLLGWSPSGDREILSLGDTVAAFSLADVKSAGAIFDEAKMRSINADYMRALDPADFVSRSGEWLTARWEPVADLVQERARTLGEVFAMTDFLFLPGPVVDEGDWSAGLRRLPEFGAVLDAAAEIYAGCEWSADALRAATAEAGERAGVRQLAKAQGPVRLAVTGRSVGPPLFESLVVLGRERTIARLAAGRRRLG
ncbi:MAG: glutamate--tRNA ligase [Acidimicrobiales bacterium]